MKGEGGRWKVESGRWQVESGKWKLAGGKWKVESGRCSWDERVMGKRILGGRMGGDS
jgi:hypothetical protein